MIQDTMRLLLLVLSVALLAVQINCAGQYKEEDNEFAEFEDFDDEDQTVKSPVSEPKTEQAASTVGGIPPVQVDEEDEIDVEDEEDNEFEHFHDEEEFEGFDSESVNKEREKVEDKETPKITITKVPLHLRTNWDSFYMEMLMLAGLVVYFLNFFTGKNKNQRLANAWLSTHKQLLEENFTLVGDDGKVDNEKPGFMKDSEHIYSLWCSGRVCCEGMLVELKFLKRQDLVAVISQMLRPSHDQVFIRVDMSRDEMDSFVFCVATKKTALRLSKDMADIALYCPERKSGEKFGLPANLSLMSEISEVSSAMLDSRIVAVLNKYVDLIDFIHFSDQYSGPKQPEDANIVKLPDVKRVLIFGFNIPLKGQTIQQAMEQMLPLMQMVFYFMDKMKRFRLSKEGKNKADKNRQRVEEAFLKTTHAARAEAAAARREEKRRQEKERILQEDDPEKQRKWEEKDMKRQMRKKAPKLKQLKVKAL